MLRRVPIGPWTPDLPTLEAPGLNSAKNCFPRIRGKGPAASLSSLTAYGALTKYARGAIALSDRDGAPENFAGDENGLYRVTGGALTDVSKGGGYTSPGKWEFSVFASEATNRLPVVLATNFTDPIQDFEIGSAALFSDLTAALAAPGTATAGAPKARHIGVVGDHVIVGFTEDGTDGKVPNRVWWPTLGNVRSWPVPGTDLAAQAQSDYQVLQGDGGEVTKITGAAEVGAIFQERAVWRADYVGGELIYSLRRVESARGCVVPHMAVPFGRRVLYLSEEGWFLFDYTGSIPVGKDRIDEFFWRDFQWEHRMRMSWLVDPDSTVVRIGYTGVGHTGGRPNRILLYDWKLDEWGLIEQEHEQLCRVRNPGENLSIDVDPQDIPDNEIGDWDTVPTALAQPGAYDASHQLATFTGTSLPVEIETADLELQPGRRSLLTDVRPVVTGGTPRVSVALLRHRQSAVSYGAVSTLNEHGSCAVRADGRYHRLKLEIDAGWIGDAIALDIEARPAGGL